jgi:hypothetical protein
METNTEPDSKILTNNKGVTYTYYKDKHGLYRNEKGHLAPGSNLARVKAEKNMLTREANRLKKKGGQAKLRDMALEHMPAIIRKLAEMAKDGDVPAAKLLLDKCLPSLRSTEITDGRALPILTVNLGGEVSRGTIVDVNENDSVQGGTPSFQSPDLPLSEQQTTSTEFGLNVNSSSEIRTTDVNLKVDVDSGSDVSVSIPTMDVSASIEGEDPPEGADGGGVYKKEEVSDTPNDFLFRVR